MAASSFDAALARVLAHEGGYSNNPDDPGGPTNFGITLEVYRRYAKPGARAADVRTMALPEAKAIYRARYWDAQRCDELPAGVDYAVFDYAVNSGCGRSGKVLRRMLYLPDATSTVTDDVLRAAKAADAVQLINAICDERLRFLKSLKTWTVFGMGWGRRVAEARRAALAMAEGRAADGDPVVIAANGRGVVPSNKPAQAATTSVVVAAGGTVAQQAQQNGAPLTFLILLVVATIAAATGAWLFWRWRQKVLQEK
jgi:lysozyme family protein